MKMPYNKWFYDQYKYLTGVRDGIKEYADTKWETINNRLRKLDELNSPLLKEQPFGVIGNQRGFDHLLDLIGRSNYTFENVNDALIDTYHYSLKNAMGRMMVNTQSVMFKTDQMDTDNVASDEFTHYYIVEAPFKEMHFGGRDNFIREKISTMYRNGLRNWMSINEFVDIFNLSNDDTDGVNHKLLPFAIIGSINGFICNDFFIAITDQGMKFKIGWPYSADAKFILYKLDVADIYTCEVDINDVRASYVPTEAFGDKLKVDVLNNKCIINIYDKNFVKTSPSVPNFGWFEEDGLHISGLQKRTLVEIDRRQSETVTVVAYVMKYFHEVQGLYPAINYFQLADKRKVYDYDGNRTTDVFGNQIYSNSGDINELEICTPPITLDRENHKAFTILASALQLKVKLMALKPILINIGFQFQRRLDRRNFIDNILEPILSYQQDEGVLKQVTDSFHIYQQMAILTSLIPYELIEEFSKVLKNIKDLSDLSGDEYEEAYMYNTDIFNGDGWDNFVDKITDPIYNSKLKPFERINDLIFDYFLDVNDNHKRFNRPVSEQCLICLRWDSIEEAWLFDLPDVERFKGIGNTFYINKGLDGNEIFKFFVLYSDTESPQYTHVDSITSEQALDFDKFAQQLETYDGYIRYWHAENSLLKLSEILYSGYNDEIITNTLSNILKHVIDGNDLLDVDMSDINYEASGITTLNVDNYDHTSEEAPFVLNYLFYTLAMLQGNEDKLQSYFYHQLVMKRFHRTYFDMFINTSEELTCPVNYSKFNMINPSLGKVENYIMGDELDSGDTDNLSMRGESKNGKIIDRKGHVVYRSGGNDHLTVKLIDEFDNDAFYISTKVPDNVTHLTQDQIDAYWDDANLNLVKISDLDGIVDDITESTLVTYYGVPLTYNLDGLYSKGHPFVFNVYSDEQKCYMIGTNSVNTDNYICIGNDDYDTFSYKNDIELARRLTFYLTYVYNGISDIQTNFATSFNQQSIIDSHIEAIGNEITLLNDVKGFAYWNSRSLDIINSIITENPFINIFKDLKKKMFNVTQVKSNDINYSRMRNFNQFINQLISDIRLINMNYGFDDIITKRVRNLYTHLKQINHQSMTCYQYEEWLNGIDVELIQIIDSLYAKNENNEITDTRFYDQSEIIISHVERVVPLLRELNGAIVGTYSELESHIKSVCNECLRIYDEYIFDLYVLSNTPSFLDVTFIDKPYLVQAIITSERHINISSTNIESTKLSFQPILDKIDGMYYIRDICKICEYTFFYGDDVEVEVFVLNNDGEILYSNTQTLTFQKIGSTSNDVGDFSMLYNMNNLLSDFQNIHQNISINSDGMVVNSNHSELNYELLYGNNLIQLEHSTQHTQDMVNMGPYDRVRVQNNMLNHLVNVEYPKRLEHQIFFKPVQVIISHDNIKPIGSRYFVGQTLYLKSKDDKCLFPITVTAMDHNINKGFIEAEVSLRSKWFEMTSYDDIKKYFNENIECEIIPDNISNFLDEFSNPSHNTFSNTNWNKMVRQYDKDQPFPNTVSVPGDPIFVHNNTPFVYTRLYWMFNELVPNRFISDEAKKMRFLYLGKFDSYDAEHITVKMINHNFDTRTLQEKYPILRTECNDHSIRYDEMEMFKKLRDEAESNANDISSKIDSILAELETNISNSVRVELNDCLDRYQIDYSNIISTQARMQSYIDYIEQPTNWHNVRSYDDAMVYIQNGKAVMSHSFVPNIRDIPYNDKLDLFIFDWEQKVWLNPNTYSIEIMWEDDIQIDQHVDYLSKHVLHRIVITPKTGFKDSKYLLLYFAYNKSDVFDDVEQDLVDECEVRFKPILSLPNRNEVFEPYKDLAIRKHVSSEESYLFEKGELV